MNLLIISQYFYPDLNSSGNVLTELAEDLQSYNQSIKVITGLPNYAGKDVAHEVTKNENYRGIEIKRLNYLRLSKDSTFGRVAGWFSFWLIAFIHSIRLSNIDSVLIVTHPPILPFLGILLKRFCNCKFCFLMHDIYPDVAIQIGKSNKDSIIVRIMDYITKISLRKADRVISLGNDMKERLVNKGTPAKNIVIIPNWADKTKISPGKKTNDFAIEHDLVDKFVLLYSGNIGLYYNLEDLVFVAEKLQKLEDLVLLFVGEGGKKQELIELTEKKKLKNVKFLPYQPWDKYNLVLNSADILIVTLQKGIEGITVPSKTYSYMASGKTIAGMISDKSDIGNLIEKSNCGFRVDPGDIEKFCKEVRRLYSNKNERERLGRNALNTFLNFYERKKVTRHFLDIL